MKATLPLRAWSLCHELGTLELATQGAAAAIAQVYESQGDERAAREAAAQAEAMLTLIHMRLRDLGRVMRGELAPEVLTGPHNVVPLKDARPNRGEDVVFASKG